MGINGSHLSHGYSSPFINIKYPINTIHIPILYIHSKDIVQIVMVMTMATPFISFTINGNPMNIHHHSLKVDIHHHFFPMAPAIKFGITFNPSDEFFHGLYTFMKIRPILFIPTSIHGCFMGPMEKSGAPTGPVSLEKNLPGHLTVRVRIHGGLRKRARA